MTCHIDTLTIEIRNPRVRELIDNLAELDLIAILPSQPTWVERWQTLSASLPDVSDVSEQEILVQIDTVRQHKDVHQ